LIDGILPGVSGIALAEIAVNENTAVLLICGHPEVSETLRRFGYPYLQKPFSLDQLLAESRLVLSETSDNIRRVKASAAKMQANTEAVMAAVAESRRLYSETKRP
jgi:DNA-binding NtrC family response regulator